MCTAQHRYGSISDFTVGPLPNEPPENIVKRITDSILADCYELTEEQKRAVHEYSEERRRQLDAEPRRGFRREALVEGWYCPNCRNCHGPHVATCPDPPALGSLRERLAR